MTVVRTRSLVTLLAVTALGLGACTNQDASGEDATDALVEAEAPEGFADCVGDRFEDDLSQEERNDVASADDLADLASGLEEQVRAILTECDESNPVGGSGDDTADTSETTDSTDEG
jgi:hypothetical protein